LHEKWKQQVRRFGPPLLGLCLLAGMAAQQMSYTEPEDVTAYHRRVEQAVKAIPIQLGPWAGSRAPVPEAARELLSPNVIVSRQYRHDRTGQVVSLMVVHCKDARDLAGHYPPVCYPANGWTKDSQQDRRWTIADPNGPATEVPVRHYRFARPRTEGEGKRTMHVLNTLMLPNGRLTREMSAVRRLAADYRSHFYGAGQLQLIVGGDVPLAQRRRLFAQFFKAMRPAVQAIGAGLKPETAQAGR
jgi:hypothetical protein